MKDSTSTGVPFREFLEIMVARKASDLYLVAGSPPACRFEGTVERIAEDPLWPAQLEALAKGILEDSQWDRFCRSLEMNLALPPETHPAARFRVNVYRQRGTIGLVIRRISTDIPTTDELRIAPIVTDLALTKKGLILVVGAAGNGKSSTLAAMIDHRNRTMPGHIVAIEDPIEFVHRHQKSVISQREVGLDTRTYHGALKNALRQAPDVVVIGEIRDRLAMEVALAIADTGHLCLGTLHSTGASQAIERIIHFFPQTRHQEVLLQLSLDLRAVIGQRLVMSKEGRRVPATELLVDTPHIKALIKKGEIDSIRDAMVQGSLEGCRLFDGSLLELYRDGTITLDEALTNADSPNNLRLKVQMARAGESDENLGTMAGELRLEGEVRRFPY
jgi:twitching motility protein PilU